MWNKVKNAVNVEDLTCLLAAVYTLKYKMSPEEFNDL